VPGGDSLVSHGSTVDVTNVTLADKKPLPAAATFRSNCRGTKL
jgi:hypothetical protein